MITTIIVIAGEWFPYGTKIELKSISAIIIAANSTITVEWFPPY